MDFFDKIPDMSDLADAYYARLEADREAMLRSVTCADCVCYHAVPDNWVKRPCGYCLEGEEIVEGDVVVAEIGCESFAGWAA